MCGKAFSGTIGILGVPALAVLLALAVLFLGGPAPAAAQSQASVPEAPAGLAFASGDGKLTVTWTAPYDGGAAISGYDVHYRNKSAADVDATTAGDPSSGWVDDGHSGTGTNHEITGLVNGRMYLVKVRAVNSVGDGPWSNDEDVSRSYDDGEANKGAAPGVSVDVQPAEGVDKVRVTVHLDGLADGDRSVFGIGESILGGRGSAIERTSKDQEEWDYDVGALGELRPTGNTAWFEIIINDDEVEDHGETIKLIVEIADGTPDADTYELARFYPSLTILDNDGFRLTHSAAPAEGGGPVTITATLGGPAPSGGVTVTLAPSGTATPGSGGDYTLSRTTIPIAGGGTTGTATIGVNDDNFSDPDETIILNATTIPSLGTYRLPLTIADNDAPPSSLTLSVNSATVSATVAENTGSVTVTATLNEPAPANGTRVTVATTGSADPGPGDGSDYTPPSPFTIAEGHRTNTFTVDIVDDAANEPNETIILDATSANPALTAPRLTLTITDNDPLPTTLTLSVNNTTVAEDTGSVTVTAALNKPAPANGTRVTVTTAATGTATHGPGSGHDYTLSSSSFAIAEGHRTNTFTIDVVDDTTDEPDETIILNASSINPALTAPRLTVTISDSYNAPPVFGSNSAVRSIAENTPARDNIGAPVAATDPDSQTLTYSLGGTDAASFDIDTSSGQLKTKAPLDYETETSYTVTVSVSDGEDATGEPDSNKVDDTITVTIRVTNVDETGAVELSASQPQVGVEVTATLSDPDRSIVDKTWQWQKSGSQSGAYTAISGATSASYTPVAGDARNYLKATVSYNDGHGSGKSAQAVSANAVAASSTNRAPTFPGGATATRSVPENTPANRNIGAPVAATDPDAGDTLTYTLGGPDVASFAIDTSSGQLKTKAALDYENKSAYTVTVSVSDGKNPGGTTDTTVDATITVTINVTNVNEQPAFPSATATRSVPENTAANVNIGAPVTATDPDAGDTLTYSLGRPDAASFSIDTSSGQLKTKAALDYDNKSTYTIDVKVSDGKNAGGTTDTSADATITVTINVTNVNEGPKFSGNLGVHSVREDAGTGVNIGAPVTAVDPEGDGLTYSLDSAGGQIFAINASTGQLQTKAALDYETARVHSVTVHVSDRKNDAGNADTAVDASRTVTINVTNVNEVPAFSGATGSRSVPENAALGDNVGDPVAATDPDFGDTLTYTLGGADASSFSIVPGTGQLRTGTALDYDTGRRSYTVTVTARDRAGLSAAITVNITVTDVNEPPVLNGRTAIEYIENDTVPVAVYTATDPDSPSVSWSLSGDDAGDFSISASGSLTFQASPDYEDPADADENNVYLVTVEGSDGAATVRLPVTVTVTNVNESPAFPAETGTRSVDENTPADRDLGPAASADDPEGDRLTYKLAGADGDSFSIDATTGQLKTKAPLDYETKSSYAVTVHVRDGNDQDDRVNAVTDDTIDITISVNNVEEPGSIVLSSRQPQVGTALVATLTDPDGGITGLTWKWHKSRNKNNWNPISGATSDSYTPIDDDRVGGRYLRVKAFYTDGHGKKKTALAVSDNPVRATPATNVAPEFDSTTAARSVDENTAADQDIGAPVAATDGDAGDAGLLTYSLSGTDAAAFDINRATGQLLTKAALDRETKHTYTVTVKVVDPSAESDTIAVTITVNDVDEPPTVSGLDVVDYPENGTNVVATYTARDPEGAAITWSLEGADKDLFSVSTGGALSFNSSPDHDTPTDANADNVYLVTVKATAGAGSGLLNVEITVSNVNETPAFPASEDGARTFAENAAANENIGAPVEATDPDSGDALTYTLGGTDAASFVIDETTGQLKTKSGVTYDYEAKSTYQVTVTATDRAGLHATVGVTITVSSVNEPPQFTEGATASRSVAENTPANQNIGAAVAATDPDSSDTLTYTLGGDDAASFTIGETNGQLKTLDPLDYETKSSYSVTVSVTDGKDVDDNADTTVDNTIDVTITVTNVAEAGNVILSSLQPQVGTALTATLEDPDGATNITWTWQSSSTWSSGWTAISGATSSSYTPVAGNVGNYLRATATYINSQNARVSAHGISAYRVRAAPASNAAPSFSAATATRSIPEDTPVGNAVGDPVTATDTNAGDVLTYTLSGTDAASFTIGMASGQLRTKVALDHDTKPSYSVVVKAEDPSGLSDTITVTITVTDQNEPPVITGETSIYYSEARTDAVATYTAADPENGSITWSLAGADSGDFSISNTGVLTFAATPDRENPADANRDNIYLVTVRASDGTNTDSLNVTVTVTDATEPPSGSRRADGAGRHDRRAQRLERKLAGALRRRHFGHHRLRRAVPEAGRDRLEQRQRDGHRDRRRHYRRAAGHELPSTGAGQERRRRGRMVQPGDRQDRRHPGGPASRSDRQLSSGELHRHRGRQRHRFGRPGPGGRPEAASAGVRDSPQRPARRLPVDRLDRQRPGFRPRRHFQELYFRGPSGHRHRRRDGHPGVRPTPRQGHRGQPNDCGGHHK